MTRGSRTTTLLIILIWVGVGAAVFVKERSWYDLAHDAEQLQIEADTDIWDVVHELSDASVVQATTDYTFWDDMAEFAEGTRDLQWAHENLDPGLSSFDIDALWVLAVDGTLRHSATKSGDDIVPAPALPLDITALRNLLVSQRGTENEEYGPVKEFYWFSDIGPLTVFVSDITSTDDPEHLKPARGYYLVAVRLDTPERLEVLRRLNITATAVRQTETPPNSPPGLDTPHVFWHEMRDYRDEVIGGLRLERAAPTFSTLLRNNTQSRWLTVGLWVFAGIASSALVFAWSRTRQRAEALAEQITRQLKESNTILEQRVAERTRDLQEDIAHRKEAEDQLLKRTSELERMNRVMLDREMRIIELKQKVPDNTPT